MRSKSENNKLKYQVVAYVKDTNQDNGPGHVSVSVMKQTPSKSKISHTSFFPGVIGSLINGLTLGSVPVRGKVSTNYEEDLHEAEHVLVKSISAEQYKSARKAQKEFSSEVTQGHRAYSVFGRLNPIASIMTKIHKFHRGAQLSLEKYKREHSVRPLWTEDFCGIEVYDNDSHITPREINPDNCTSSTTHVLQGAGIKFDNPCLPTLFTSKLQGHGFEEVNKDEFEKSLG